MTADNREFCFVGLKNNFYGIPVPYRSALNLNVQFNRFLLSECPCSQLWAEIELCQPWPLQTGSPSCPLSHSSLPPPEVTTTWTFLEITALPFVVVVCPCVCSLGGFSPSLCVIVLLYALLGLPWMMRPSSLCMLCAFSAHCFAGAVDVVDGWPRSQPCLVGGQ